MAEHQARSSLWISSAVYVFVWSSQILAARGFATVSGSRRELALSVLYAELVKLGVSAHQVGSGDLRVALTTAYTSSATPKVLLCGVLYTTCNLLAFINIGELPAAVYQVMISARIAFAAAADWWSGARVSASRVEAALLCSLAMAVSSSATPAGWRAAAWVLLQGAISTTAGFVNQGVVREEGASLAQANAALYLCTSTLSAGVVLSSATGLGDLLPPPGPFFFGCVALTAAGGLSTSYLLRKAGNTVKTMLSGFELFVVAVGARMLFGEDVSARVVVAMWLTVLGFAADCSAAWDAAWAAVRLTRTSRQGVCAVALALVFASNAIANPRNKDAWRTVWDARGGEDDRPLHQIDGFDGLSAAQYDLLLGSVLNATGVPLAAAVWGDELLDLGCGAGAFLDFCRRSYPAMAATGVDYSAGLLAVAARRTNATVVVHDLRASRRLPLRDAAFQFTLSWSVLSYLESEAQVVRLLDECGRVTAADGFIVFGDVSDAAKVALADALRASTHYARLDYSRLRHLHVRKCVFSDWAARNGRVARFIDEGAMVSATVPDYSQALYRYTVVLAPPFFEAPLTPIDQCVRVPPDPRLALPQFQVWPPCEEAALPPFYTMNTTAWSDTVLRMEMCVGGGAPSYRLFYPDLGGWAATAAAASAVSVPSNASHVEVMCGERRHYQINPSYHRPPSSPPLADKSAAARPAGGVNVLMLSIDAMSRTTFEALYTRLLPMLREGRFSAARTFEFRGLSTIGYNTEPNWEAMLCGAAPSPRCAGGHCDHRHMCTANVSLLDLARPTHATMLLNNWCPQYPDPYAGPPPHIGVGDDFVCLAQRDGLGRFLNDAQKERASCAAGDSVLKSWLGLATEVVATAQSPASPRPVFGWVSINDAHTPTELGRAARMEAYLVDMLSRLNATTLADTVLILSADHGMHYDHKGHNTDPARGYALPAIYNASAHRAPPLFVLAGRNVPETAAASNAGRLVSMFDLYVTMGRLLFGERYNEMVPSTEVTRRSYDILNDDIPASRTCAAAGIQQFCNCWQAA